ncbi:MAG TPA: LPS-assembly protein LptD [Propylenella sp.]|nr:LPS-assembly protein LptD [Propylenella sp.]
MSNGRLLAACAVAALLVAPVLPAIAQSPDSMGHPVTAGAGQQMLLEAEQLLYDFDREVVTAIGDVKIYYGSAVLDAERVEYDQRAGTLVAAGGVRLQEPNGNILTAERMTLSDDFRDAFIASLNVITTDRAHFSAQTAERRGGNLLIFRQGIYTACEPCLENPGKPPLWQIKAQRIIHDQTERTVHYQNAKLEFFGFPIAYLPYMSHPDPTVKRKTGFLTPTLMETEAIGFGVTTPVFWNLAPHYDVTFSPTFLTRQGILLEAEWRHRLMNGAYTVRVAGIFQQDKEVFRDNNGDPLSGYEDFRGSARTAGEFALTSRWTTGWDVHGTTDRTFNRDYRVAESTARDLTSTIYLTGLSDSNFFDLRGYYFNVQRENTVEEIPDGPDADAESDLYVHDDQSEQAVVHPVLDHNYVVASSVFGGQLRFDSNLASLSRGESDVRHPPTPFDPYYAGVAGTFSRASSRASWERRFIAPNGQLITPFAYLQGDLNFVAADDPAAGLGEDDFIARAMPAVGVEYEWPFLATIGSWTHTFGPKAQIIARPNEQFIGDLPNEDSQSLVFDGSTLFVLDKFAGYDRQEGGTRANVGFIYRGFFPNGASIDALIGQSYQIAGVNSFATEDQSLTGVGSGLESDASDYVAGVTLSSGTGVALTARARLDDKDFGLNRGEVNAIGTYRESVASLGYAYIRESPSAGIFENRQEVGAAASVAVTDTWSVLGALTYDVENHSSVKRSFGLAYADECFEISAVYSDTPEQYSDLVTGRQVFVRISLRTLGDTDLSSELDRNMR